MTQFACTAYGNGPTYGVHQLGAVPATFWRKIELLYPDGRVVVFVYETETPEDEYMELMMQLQTSDIDYEIWVTCADGTRVQADKRCE